jgi:16S rRNA (uracil1498-N3)-methyltransferase
MKHVPHLVLAAPWAEDTISLSIVQWRHVSKVLRLHQGDRVSYTDGVGRFGVGVLGHQLVKRGEESDIPRPNGLIMAVAPPANRDRQRFVVEKLAELGISRLIWLKSSHGQDRTPSSAKTFAWVLSAVEQSRGSWLMETDAGLRDFSDLEGPVAVCHPGGDTVQPQVRTVVIGPEGGFLDDEIPQGAVLWDLGPTILRVETAAVVAAARLIS